jgi:hypothetical protein
MNQLVASWNLTKDILGIDKAADTRYSTISLRGSSTKRVGLPAESRLFLKDNPKACLSVSDIAGGICPRAIDVYLYRSPYSPLEMSHPGASILRSKIKKGSYQQRAGNLFEDALSYTFANASVATDIGYQEVVSQRTELMRGFSRKAKFHLDDFKSVEPPHRGGGNALWFVRQLECSIGQELGARCVQKSLLKDASYLGAEDVKPNPTIELSDPRDIGIRKAVPDFLVERAKLVGDIKTGERFQKKYMLSCAGYAITFEKKRRRHIDWGAIIFQPTEVCLALYQPMTFPQVYFFRITDDLRTAFLNKRDDIYRQNQEKDVSNAARLAFKEEPKTCESCQHADQCREIFGLSIPE